MSYETHTRKRRRWPDGERRKGRSWPHWVRLGAGAELLIAPGAAETFPLVVPLTSGAPHHLAVTIFSPVALPQAVVI